MRNFNIRYNNIRFVCVCVKNIIEKLFLRFVPFVSLLTIFRTFFSFIFFLWYGYPIYKLALLIIGICLMRLLVYLIPSCRSCKRSFWDWLVIPGEGQPELWSSWPTYSTPRLQPEPVWVLHRHPSWCRGHTYLQEHWPTPTLLYGRHPLRLTRDQSFPLREIWDVCRLLLWAVRHPDIQLPAAVSRCWLHVIQAESVDSKVSEPQRESITHQHWSEQEG